MDRRSEPPWQPAARYLAPGDEVTFWKEGDHVAVRPARSDRPLHGRYAGRPLVKTLEAERDADRRREDRR